MLPPQVPDTYIHVDFRVCLENQPDTGAHRRRTSSISSSAVPWRRGCTPAKLGAGRKQRCLWCLRGFLLFTSWACSLGWILRSRLSESKVSTISKAAFPKVCFDWPSNQRPSSFCIPAVPYIFPFSDTEKILHRNVKKNHVKSRRKVY